MHSLVQPMSVVKRIASVLRANAYSGCYPVRYNELTLLEVAYNLPSHGGYQHERGMHSFQSNTVAVAFGPRNTPKHDTSGINISVHTVGNKSPKAVTSADNEGLVARASPLEINQAINDAARVTPSQHRPTPASSEHSN